MAKKLVKNYVFTPGKGLDQNERPNAYSLILQNRTFIIKEIVAYIQNQVDASDPDYVGYTYSVAKCERDSGYVIDALLSDLRYGGNEQIYKVASTYWNGSVAQIDGNRIPEYEAYQFAITLINTFILTNTADLSPEQNVEVQVIDLSKTTENGTTTRVSTLLGNLVSVIQNGLGSLPVLDVKLGRIELLGKIELEDLLLISNVTNNIVIYNFAEPTKGGTIEFTEGNSANYPNALSVSNGTSVIRFKFDTSSMSSSDSIQVFLENTELKIRPYDFGTDAIERMRVAQPQAMIDADFEYGLQPTKWQAIGMQRGYPSTYELSATDIPVSSVTTDASTGSSGIGSSLITVTTVSAHGLTAGTPISIRALAASITGFNRAEGTFLIFDAPTSTTFRYYAKAKVGTSNGQVLATSTTQLRQAAFYTGASVGTPSFSVYSNGAGGSFTTTIRAETGTNTLPFIGVAPTIGQPLSSSTTGIPSGAQVSGVFGTSNSDGIQDYRYVKTTYSSGATAIDLMRVDELSAGMGVGNEAVPNVLREITSIVGNTLNLSGAVSVGRRGDENSYSGGATARNTTGTNATLNVSVTSGVYSITGIANGGSGYSVGDTLYIYGPALGGNVGVHDLYINVDTVSSGVITAVSIISGTGTGTNTYNSVVAAGSTSRGTGVTFAVLRSGGVYFNNGISGGTNYRVGNRFTIPGSNFEGTDGVNDCTITVTSIDGSGGITGVTLSGTVVRGEMIAVYATISMSDNLTANFAANSTVITGSIATLQVTFASDHGFVPGMSLNVLITSAGTNHSLGTGPVSVEQIVDSRTFRYTARTTGTIDDTTTITGIVYVRPDVFFTHRPFDGGVMLGTGGPQHGGQAVRQSKKYIRYQSGKGAMYNTGALFAPSFDVSSITASGTASGSFITIALDDMDHGIQAGAQIKLSGVETTGYDGTYTVSEIIDERTFKVTAGTALGSTTGSIGSQCQISLYRWHGAIVRSGPFDDQNGIFYQYDGQQLSVGRRTSTFQCAGTIAINTNENIVTGTNTRFLDQLQEGDRVVIRGMTHVVAKITNNTSMTVTPDFRGVSNITGVKMCKVEDVIIPQSQWNLDKCDGTGPSGYNIDVTKMQMIGIQFSWYGAGFIDWMFRGPNGDYIFCHRLKGNNLNTEAYMRTGNLPVRYEVLNEGARSRLNGAINDLVTTVTLDDTTFFPSSGTIYVDNELISYSGKNSSNQLTGCTRAATLSNFAAGAVRTYTAGEAASHADNQGVVLISNTTSPIISHWGSAYLIDGNFDEDRGYIFNYAATGISASIDKKTAFLIRLAPSVSNAVTGDLGEKELLNRAQLLLNSLSLTSDAVSGGGALVVEGVLNPNNYPTDPTKISWNGLTSSAAGGQPSFAQIALGGSVTWGGIPATTQNGTVQGALTTTVSAISFNVVTYTITAASFATATSVLYNRAFSTTRNDILITTSSYDALTSPIVVGDRLSNATYLAGDRIVTAVTRNFTTLAGVAYTRIVMSSNAGANSPAATVNGNANISVTVTNTVSSSYNRAIRAGFGDFLITTSQFDSSGLLVGDAATNGSFFPSKAVTGIQRNYARISGTDYTRIICSDSAGVTNSTAGSGNNVTMTVTAATSSSSYVNTNYLFFTSASWIASGAIVGTRVATTDTKFPANTAVASISTRTLGGTTVYRVTFTQNANTTIAAAATVTFQFGDPQYALPGEQVFSFIANPGETGEIDLNKLKELGTTSIGGRGTFPNGPDVLAINVYKIAGTATTASLILKWGEAQA